VREGGCWKCGENMMLPHGDVVETPLTRVLSTGDSYVTMSFVTMSFGIGSDHHAAAVVADDLLTVSTSNRKWGR
jgi:hypothetical protein